ncbi:hypothetical protein TIFTF001_039096 [Ficus carica]|uniref:Uncharacterized protein n=1 Tax=Ficus carica TaxID=3494 RepID=A0AA88JD34_FICCA|nr:hypothetical protein TIFTF001_037780 [Ficus carica]GMN68737.1 hypothetical protein TIFTF001_037789 [Ficus carica]GMN70045.1 hypothetical protein TIFTF001_039088 [Ficus carica]GMN70054.1 hypothetical protein TIFTF001_039096 [Ficus carica]
MITRVHLLFLIRVLLPAILLSSSSSFFSSKVPLPPSQYDHLSRLPHRPKFGHLDSSPSNHEHTDHMNSPSPPPRPYQYDHHTNPGLPTNPPPPYDYSSPPHCSPQFDPQKCSS